MSFKQPINFRKAESKTLVTDSEKEKRIMKKSAKDIVQHHPNCTGIIIPKVSHGISLYDPNFFNQMIEKWLEEGTFPQEVIFIK